VPAEVLGPAVERDINPQRQRRLVDRRGEGVVYRGDDALFAPDGGDGAQVNDLEQRVGRRLDVDEPGLRRNRGADGFGLGRDEADRHAEPGQFVGREGVCAAIEVLL